MPLFKYQCLACNKIFEELVIRSSDKVACPECKSDKTIKMVSLISSKGISSGCGSSCTTAKCKPG
ncbi:MAG: FmdB family zinc ribbon protein [bacterium]